MTQDIHYMDAAMRVACKGDGPPGLLASDKASTTCWRCVHVLLGWALPEEPALPEHAKLKAAKGPRGDDTQLIGEFLVWLGEQNIRLARYADNDELRPLSNPTELLNGFFEVDANALSAEKDLLLEHMRALHAAQNRAKTEGRAALQRT